MIDLTYAFVVVVCCCLQFWNLNKLNSWLHHFSELLKDQVAEDVLQTMVEEHNYLRPGDLSAAIQHQANHRIEVSLARWDMPGIDVVRLESCEEQLTGSNIIAK